MTDKPPPITELQTFVDRNATGEFICATSVAEYHVYLQRGRIAWATSSAHPHEFARHIRRQRNIDEETFRQVLETCRREKLPLGETLVDWKLATWDDIKAALRHQVQLTFTELVGLRSAETMFLERRRFTEYSPELTLELNTILQSLAPARREEPALLPAVPTPAPENPDEAAIFSSLTPENLSKHLPSVLWAEQFDGPRFLARSPAGASLVPTSLAGAMTASNVELLAIRFPERFLLGVKPRSRSLSGWCMIGTESAYGMAISTLVRRGLLFSTRPEEKSGGSQQSQKTRWVSGSDRVSMISELKNVLEFSREVLSVMVTAPDGSLIAGVGQAAEPSAEQLGVLRNWAPMIFSGALTQLAPSPEGSQLALGLRSATIGTAEHWYFGVESLGDTQELLWVVASRTASQGLGAACVTSLLRGLGRIPPVPERKAS